MLKKFVTLLGGNPNKRAIEKMLPVVARINELEEEFETLEAEALKAKTGEFRARLQAGETLDDLLPEAFAAVREASKRTLGLRHYDVQLIGGIVLHQGKIAEMRTGEGKTLVATLPLYLNALTGRGVHLVTVNDYLARRDARWMGKIYAALGMTVGVLQMAARTENGKKAFLVDFERESPHEDQNQLRMVPRVEAYAADITYGTNSEFGFDYLRDNMTLSLDERVQRGHYYAIVDEVDNVLIDEARTPLIISGPAHDDTEWYMRMAQVVRQLREEDYEINIRDRTVTLTETGEAHVEDLLGLPLRDPDRPEDVTPEQARLLGFLEQALRAQHLFKKNKDYLVQGGKVIIIDEFTGRLMPGRRWSDGLHQAVEAKEGVRVQSENVTYATITIQNYFRMYEKLAGMSGTAVTEAEEFDKIYKLSVVAIPTHLEYQASLPEAGLMLLEGRDEDGYKFRYYARKEDAEKRPVFWQRKDYPDVIYRTEEIKFRAIVSEILRNHVMGRPVLVGTTSVQLSDRLSGRLRAEPLRRLALTTLLRSFWMEKNNRVEDGRLIPELQPLYEPLDLLQMEDLRKMAKNLGISTNPEEAQNLSRLCNLLNLSAAHQPRLKACLQGGIPHKVLNAREHDKESSIIAGAGALGAVTIATNMAGRGVDIKLGGEIDEDIITHVKKVLKDNGIKNPYGLTNAEMLEHLLKFILRDEKPSITANDDKAAYFRQIRAALIGKYGRGASQDEWGQTFDILYNYFGVGYKAVEKVIPFWKHTEEELQVRSLGGLAVIGSERHEARRIDNQLRGRSARQGDPGTARFYLSLQDELMSRFGGEQVEGLMKRLRIDDAVPMEMGLVSRIVESSQTRVEGANFDIRKHLLEYDDVLNQQRQLVYAQRDRIFNKEDLSEDVAEMLRTEVQQRVPQALKNEQGPWTLLAWLEQIQPTLVIGNLLFPSYTLRLLQDQIVRRGELNTPEEVKQALLDLAQQALEAEEEHLIKAIEASLESARRRLENQVAERLETLETYFEGLSLGAEEGTELPQPRQIRDEISAEVGIQVRLSPEELALLQENPRQVLETVRVQVQSSLLSQAIIRLIGTVERRLEEPLELNSSKLPEADWNQISEQIMKGVKDLFERRRQRLLGNGAVPASGQLSKDLEVALGKNDNRVTRVTNEQLLSLLVMLSQGTRTTFDKKTHQAVRRRTTRLVYIYYAAKLLAERDSQTITEDVLQHLEQAQNVIRRARGMDKFSQLAKLCLPDLDEQTREQLSRLLSDEQRLVLQTRPLQSLEGETVLQIIDELGRKVLTEAYRELLLRVITELWVDYLTQMEALRVSIGLEAYAQRDPLVEYKSKASTLFQNLLSDMRLGVITRMFTYRPREINPAPAETRHGAMERQSRAREEIEETVREEQVSATMQDSAKEAEALPAGDERQPAAGLSRSQKRRRRRR